MRSDRSLDFSKKKPFFVSNSFQNGLLCLKNLELIDELIMPQNLELLDEYGWEWIAVRVAMVLPRRGSVVKPGPKGPGKRPSMIPSPERGDISPLGHSVMSPLSGLNASRAIHFRGLSTPAIRLCRCGA
jgi:hypothetical protein